MKSLSIIGLTFVLMWGAMGTALAQSKPIRFGYYNYEDVIYITHVVKYVLEHKMHRKVKLIKASPGVIYESTANGNIDFFTAAWLPKTQAAYYKKVAGKVWDVGPIYTGARLGWVVPDYIPKDKINSIEDLKSKTIMNKLGGKIVGIGAGAGLTKLSQEVMKKYGLNKFGYRLQISSGPAMLASLERAIHKKQWIVVTGWSPHMMFARWNLRYLSDPKGIFKTREHVDALVRHGFAQDDPKVYAFLARLSVSLQAVEEGMNQSRKTSYEDAARQYVETHPVRVHYWVTGKLPH